MDSPRFNLIPNHPVAFRSGGIGLCGKQETRPQREHGQIRQYSHQEESYDFAPRSATIGLTSPLGMQIRDDGR